MAGMLPGQVAAAAAAPPTAAPPFAPPPQPAYFDPGEVSIPSA